MTLLGVEGTEQKLSKGNIIFALDIGTRSVIGVVGRRSGDVFEVECIEQRPHTKRAMYDGQIEDIGQVAAVISEVKEALEERLGFTLSEVCVAAAGRSLRTSVAENSCKLDYKVQISEEQIKTLELSAVEIAQQRLDEGLDEGEDMLCVGHSVMGYYLDNYKMSQVLGHKGKELRVEIIATFLPAAVVDSLRIATELAGLTVRSMTLEPIAASNAVIPRELRLLNLALVDVGAGTSDIAISSGGSITAYTMATIAGDEVTESLMRAFLMDFNEAERVKQLLGTKLSSVQFVDILGNARSESVEVLLSATETAVKAMAAEIAGGIKASSPSTPVAVFLVGGGSKSPGLNRFLSEELGLEESKIAVGGSSYMQKQTTGNVDGTDPELATPLGIAITAMHEQELDKVSVSVNGKRLKVDRRMGCTVMNVLLLAGVKYAEIMGKRGKSLTFTLNGEKIVVRGGDQKPADIMIGGKSAHISTEVKSGDVVEAVVHPVGEDANVLISNYAKIWNGRITVDGRAYLVGSFAKINGEPADGDTRINNLDSVEITSINTLEQLLEVYDLSKDREYFLGDKKLEFTEKLIDGMEFTSKPVGGKNDIEQLPEGYCSAVNIIFNGTPLTLPPKEGTGYTFLDLFAMVDIDPQKVQGKVALMYNGKELSSYLQPLNNGDTAEISVG